MTKHLIIWLLFLACSLPGATYYVRTDGNNANTGLTDSAAGAWRNIWYAAHTDSATAAGDTVIIKAGTYNEYVTNLVSGTTGNPITFVGERSGNEWQTIIDPSTSLDTGWYPAGFGSGTYSNAGLSFVAREVEISGRRVMGLKTLGLLSVSGIYLPDTVVTNGTDFFYFATNQVITYRSENLDFWTGFGALWAATNNTLYLRLWDGSDPNGIGVTASDNAPYLTSQVIHPAIRIEGQNYITWSNVLVRGGFAQFLLKGTSTHHITITSNYLTGGYARIYVQDGCSNNVIAWNQVIGNFYGTNNTGAWGDSTSAFYLMRAHLYSFS